ncbi:MAG: type I-C CRISPR-associated protein Cas5c, partial [Planctomycetota bacterium]|nr:type I-C CRISPR-associated protein Cas5c [Planctomycetota bacterium]
YSAILWKPAIRWRITRIDVLNQIRFASVRRNEVALVATQGNREGIYVEEARQQRAGLILRDVRYRLHAEFEYIPPEKRTPARNPLPNHLGEAETFEGHGAGPDEKEAKYAAMFGRRADKGQCFTQPYLGCREFSCHFRRIQDSKAEPAEIHESLRGERDLGWMLYDLDYSDENNPTPLFFRAVVRDGTLAVPARDSGEVRG